MKNTVCKYSFHDTLLNVYFVLITHKILRHMSLLTLLLTNSTFWSYLQKHSEENYLQYVALLTSWFMLRWLFIQPCNINITMWLIGLISTPQIMNGKYSQWTAPKHSEGWEINTGEVFYYFMFKTFIILLSGEKVSLLLSTKQQTWVP